MARKSTSLTLSFFAFQDIVTSIVGIFLLVTLVMALDCSKRPAREGEPAITRLSETSHCLADELEEIEAQIEAMRTPHALSSIISSGRLGDLEKDLERIEEQQRHFDALNSRTIQAIQEAEDAFMSLVEKSALHSQQQKELEQLIGSMAILEQAVSSLRNHASSYHRASIEKKGLVLVDITAAQITFIPLSGGSVAVFDGVDMTDKAKPMIEGYADDCHLFLLVRPGGVACFRQLHALLQARNASFGFDAVADSTFPLAGGGK